MPCPACSRWGFAWPKASPAPSLHQPAAATAARGVFWCRPASPFPEEIDPTMKSFPKFPPHPYPPLPSVPIGHLPASSRAKQFWGSSAAPFKPPPPSHPPPVQTSSGSPASLCRATSRDFSRQTPKIPCPALAASLKPQHTLQALPPQCSPQTFPGPDPARISSPSSIQPLHPGDGDTGLRRGPCRGQMALLGTRWLQGCWSHQGCSSRAPHKFPHSKPTAGAPEVNEALQDTKIAPRCEN